MGNNRGFDRRGFLAAAGVTVAGVAAVPSLSQETIAKDLRVPLRRRVVRPYDPDVWIVGGDPAGIDAALGAAGHEANTLLIEHDGCFGGVATFHLRDG